MTSSVENKPLSHVDAAWLRMDTAVNPMVITSALTIEGSVPFPVLQRVIEERFLSNERFRLRIADTRLPLVPPRWERDPHFDIRSHVHHVRLPAPGGARALDDFVSDLMSTRLDPTRPLWQTYIVDDVPGGTAMVSRLHHCLADGVALVKVLQDMCDPPEHAPPVPPAKVRPRTELNFKRLAARAASYAATMGRLLMLPADSPNPLRGALSTRKSATRCDAIPLAALKAKSKQLGGTLNDLLAAIVSGALHNYLRAQGVDTAGLSLRALVPVFLRDLDDTGIGNHFGLVFLDLPVGIADRRERFAAVKRNMDRLKAQDDATVAFAVMDAVGIASTELEHIWLEVFSRKASLLTSNVPGPPDRLYIAGRPMIDVTVWSPVSGYLGVGFTAVSYAGQMRVSLHTDASLIPDPSSLARAFSEEAAHFLTEGAVADIASAVQPAPAAL